MAPLLVRDTGIIPNCALGFVVNYNDRTVFLEPGIYVLEIQIRPKRIGEKSILKIEIPNTDRYICSHIRRFGAKPCLDSVAPNNQIIRTLWIFVLLRPCLASGSIGTVATRTDENREKRCHHQAQDSMDAFHFL